MNILLVAFGGCIGSIFRFYISVKVNKRLFGTWIANLTGAILLALLLRYHLAGAIPDWVWVFAGIGFCGAYTTFSTFGNETMQLIFEKKYTTAVGYVVSSFAISLLCVYFILAVFA